MIHYQKRTKEVYVMTTDFERYLFAKAMEYKFVSRKESIRGEMIRTRSQKKYWRLNENFNGCSHRAYFWERVADHFCSRLDGLTNTTIERHV